jgi:hypothetical protein
MTRVLSLLALTASLFAPGLLAAEEPLGRLFFTPQQRAALDAGRRLTQAKPQSATKPQRARAPGEIMLNGIVTRSDGQEIVWVNGKPLEKQSAGRRVKVKDPATATIQVGSDRTVELRVGERYGRTLRKREPAGSDSPRSESAKQPKPDSPGG